MKCDMCDNEASVYLTQIIGGQMTKVNLCDRCSKEKGVTDPQGFQFAEMLMGSSGQKKAKAIGPEADDSLACPVCGFTRAHLKKIGRLGCPECYKTFSEDLDAMLRAMHKGTRHVGKIPGKIPIAMGIAPPPKLVTPASGVNVEKRLAELKLAIEHAVAEERYEDAAKLRDEMRRLEARVS